MLPTRLELKNFLAYQNPDPIYFEGIHLACLSGPNGAGKSSLLDAITWAIWGKARARSDDDLIHLGCDEMSVTLEFLQGDARYRILRQRRLGNKRKSGGRAAGTTTLDLVGWVPEENTFRVISEPSVRQTQARIEDLVGVDYETFVNSAYLQQGHADAFTVQSPAHRKKILSEILNLDVWQDYEELAKLRLREINSELQAIGTNLREIEKEIAEEPAIQREYALAQEQHDTAREQMLHAETRYRELAGADHELNAALNELNQVRFQIGERERDIASTEAQITHYHQRLEDYQAMVLERESIEAGYARLQEAREADQALGDALRQLHQIDQWISSLREQIATARQGIEQDIT
ncbi:MAG: SMC family ATPase, partial [Chloroflexi bacterium]|nr:SMC family ATPase [Chloroflexota bacterium]